MSPVCVDLDGTLVCADTLWLAFTALARSRPWRALASLCAIPIGKARFKQSVANAIKLDASRLPYRQDLLEWLLSERAAGRRLILATGADQSVAKDVAAHLNLFDGVLASDGTVNLTGPRKAAAIRTFLKGEPFVYAGDSSDDMEVWKQAEAAIVVDPTSERLQALRNAGIPVVATFGEMRRPSNDGRAPR